MRLFFTAGLIALAVAAWQIWVIKWGLAIALIGLTPWIPCSTHLGFISSGNTALPGGITFGAIYVILNHCIESLAVHHRSPRTYRI